MRWCSATIISGLVQNLEKTEARLGSLNLFHQRGISSPVWAGFPPRRFMILSKALKSACAFRSAKNSATCRADNFSATAVATN